ncbi:MAG: hypothetical protein QOE36_3038 [Gaiellaceae bacterium]|nr:hypothetical protein [Gaiellaceae bacterium]
MTTAAHTHPAASTAEQIFDSILVGVDGSPEGLEAVRQAALLAVAGGGLTLLAAWNPALPFGSAMGGPSGYADTEGPRLRALDALGAAGEHAADRPSPATKVARGLAWQALIAEIERQGDTLVVVGSHGQSRTAGIISGSTATELIHKAPCSVLVARHAPEGFPRRIAVGVDGSPESAAAYSVARSLAMRFDAEVWPVVAHGGAGVDKRRVAEILDYHHEDLQDEPVQALVAVAADADLLVVGSRGLQGVKALGSVSERVAHRARCSTLIVRG